MLDAIIVQYLAGNKRLVLPEMGAFLRKDGGEIVFVEFLKKDDQVLTGLVSNAFSVGDPEARAKVENYISNIRETVDKAGVYTIQRLGHLVKENGIYTFRYDPTAIAGQASVKQEKPEPAPTPTAPTQAITNDIVTPVSPVRETVREESLPSRPSATVAPKPQPTGIPVRDTPGQSTPPPRPSTPSQERARAPIPKPKTPVLEQAEKPVRKRPARPVDYRSGRKKTDLVMIIAIIAALIAIGSMVFGVLVNNDPVINIQPTSPVETVETLETPQEEGTEAVDPGQ